MRSLCLKILLGFGLTGSLFTGCGRQDGTITGNPSRANSGQVGGIESVEIMSQVCQVLSRCHSNMTQENCSLGVRNSTGFGERLGLGSSVALTFAQIIQFESSGFISANRDSSYACQTEMTGLSCDNPRVQNAFDAGNTNDPFGAAPNLLGAPCASALKWN